MYRNRPVLKRLDCLSTSLLNWLIDMMNWIQRHVGFNLSDRNQWHDLAHYDTTKFMLKFGRVGELFLDKGYAETFDMADSMAKFNFVNCKSCYKICRR
jgi:hypothetical protein